tara:strand:- start:12 stop:122 length:111 start_codon:yes stop_codon:yes gene_type:complete
VINELNKRKQSENLFAGARKFPLLRALEGVSQTAFA